MLLDNTPEYKLIWDKVYKKFNFKPSVNPEIIPFKINEPHVIYKIDKMTKNQIEKAEIILEDIFKKLCDNNKKVYALDWHHSAFLYNPNNKNQNYTNKFPIYFPSFYPDGDYYFFIEENFNFGYLSHPWRQEVWIFGKELINEIEKISDLLGFKKIN